MKLAHFYQRLVVRTKRETYSFESSDKAPHILNIEHTNNFDGSNRPSNTETTVHSIKNEHKNIIIQAFQQGSEVSLYAGWYNPDYTESLISHVTTGTISSIHPMSKIDASITFSIKDGTDYSKEKTIKVEQARKSKAVRTKASIPNAQQLIKNNERKTKRMLSKHVGSKKYYAMEQRANNRMRNYRNRVNKRVIAAKKRADKQEQKRQKIVYKAMSFKAGTSGETIIKAIAKKANISITALHLEYNHKYLKGYVANKKPLQVITDVANDCKTPPFYRHGHLYIEKLGTNHKLNLTIEPSTGLMGTPQPQIDYIQKHAKPNEYSYQIQFVYRSISVGDVFYLKSKELTGEVIALSGANAKSNGSVPNTTCVVKLLSAYNKEQKQSIADAKKKQRTIAKSLRDKQTRTALNKRQKRANNRKKVK